MSTEGSGATRSGGTDFHNEDVFVVDDGLGLYLVCDGASGTPAGEVASRTAAMALEEFIERAEETLDFRGDPVARRVVGRAMDYAMDAVAEAGRSDPKLRGLATTVTMLLAHRRVGVIGHRGDSRAYLIRRGRVRQLTVDDELTQSHANGPGAEASCDVFSLDLEPRDTLILCTDGAEEVVEEGVFARTAEDLAPQLLASRIASAANRKFPEQDSTVVVVRVRGDAEPGWVELSESPRRTAFGHAIPVPAAG